MLCSRLSHLTPRAITDIAHDYLTFRKNPYATLNYIYCPYCPSHTLTKSTIQHQIWDCPCIQKFWDLIHHLFNQLNLPFPLTTFNDIITFFSLDDIKSLTSTFKNQLIFNGVFAIWAEYSKLTFEFNQFHQMDAPELDSYINNLTQRLLTRYNSLNHHSFLSMPYIHQDIAFRSHIKGNLDPTKSALQARFYQLKPFLNFNSSNITDTIRQAYLDTWCKHSILGSFQHNKVIFHPLKPPQAHLS